MGLSLLARLLFATCLLAQPAAVAKPETSGDRRMEMLRKIYREEAEEYKFYLDQEQQQPLKLVEAPVQRWSQDDDWSGDVFVWTRGGRPVIVGCLLSGPISAEHRFVYDEFHLLSEQPIAEADLQGRRRWRPTEGLKRLAVPDAPKPAGSAPVRLVQMRGIARKFAAHMEADGEWVLRLLPQPLYRFGDEEGDVVDGALFTYVWNKGTDPELMLLLECRKTNDGLQWRYAPARFSNRQLWLRYDGQEVWRVDSHQEPGGNVVDLIYTTNYVRAIPTSELAAKAGAEEP